MAILHYQLTRDEVLRSVLRRRMLSPGRLILGGILLVGGVTLLALPLHAADTGAFLILFVLFMNGLLYVILRRAVDKATWLTAPTTLEYGEAGITLDAGGMRHELKWNAFGRWKRTPPHLL